MIEFALWFMLSLLFLCSLVIAAMGRKIEKLELTNQSLQMANEILQEECIGWMRRYREQGESWKE